VCFWKGLEFESVGAGEVSQVIECLPSKGEALSSNISMAKTKTETEFESVD
jgi:hypothetical protein